MSNEDCAGKIELHTHMLNQHEMTLQQFSSIPEIISSLKLSLDRLNATIERLEEKVQTQSQCKAIHDSLDKLRAEQLMQIRSDNNNMGVKITALETKVCTLEAECNTARGSILFLKWSIPVLVSISIVAAKLIN